MDIFRIPKFSYYFYKSQQDIVFSPNSGKVTNPVVFIADYYTNDSDPRIRVFSNCEKITLKINGKEIATNVPDNGHYSSNLKHPPFTFHIENYAEGTLTAIGYMNDKKAAEHTIKTPLNPEKIQLSDNCSEIKPFPGKKDVFFVYASLVDKNGTIVPSAEFSVSFEIEGPAEILGSNPVVSEAGISSILVQSSGESGIVQIFAKNKHFETAVHKISIE
jgi:beta-galactosidase